VVIALVVWALTNRERAASACGAVLPAYWTLTAAVPTAEMLPTDGAILLQGKAWSDIPRDSGELSQAIVVTVRDAAGADVPGTVEAWYLSTEPTAIWRAMAALAPNQSFILSASALPQAERPALATGDTTLTTTFHTGDQPALPLVLQGTLRVTLETYDQPVWKDCICGNCTPNGSIRGLRARVTIPAAQGGSTTEAEGYSAWLWITNDRAHALPDGPGGTLVNLGGLERLPAGRASDVFIPVPEEDQGYVPCFTARVIDPSGHFADPPVVCLASLEVKAKIAEIDGAQGGCALVALSGPALPTWPGAIIAAALTSLARRRRARRTC
jgi:hypothetical protein